MLRQLHLNVFGNVIQNREAPPNTHWDVCVLRCLDEMFKSPLEIIESLSVGGCTHSKWENIQMQCIYFWIDWTALKSPPDCSCKPNKIWSTTLVLREDERYLEYFTQQSQNKITCPISTWIWCFSFADNIQIKYLQHNWKVFVNKYLSFCAYYLGKKQNRSKTLGSMQHIPY